MSRLTDQEVAEQLKGTRFGGWLNAIAPSWPYHATKGDRQNALIAFQDALRLLAEAKGLIEKAMQFTFDESEWNLTSECDNWLTRLEGGDDG
jgi:hypothetical protein